MPLNVVNKTNHKEVFGKPSMSIHASSAKDNPGRDLFQLDKDVFKKDDATKTAELFHKTNKDGKGVYMKIIWGDEVRGPDIDDTYRKTYKAVSTVADEEIGVVEIGGHFYEVLEIEFCPAEADRNGDIIPDRNEHTYRKFAAVDGKAVRMHQIKEVIVLCFSADSAKELGRGLRGDSWFSWRTLLGLNHLKNAPMKTNENLLTPGKEVEANPTLLELFQVFLYQILAPISGSFPEIISKGVDPITKEPVFDKFGNTVEVILSKPHNRVATLIYGLISGVGLTFMILALTVFGFPFASPIPILFLLMAASPVTLGLLKTLYKNGLGLSVLAAGLTGLLEICLTRYGQAKNDLDRRNDQNKKAGSWPKVIGYRFLSIGLGILASAACMPIGILNKDTPLDHMKLPPNVKVAVFLVIFKYIAKNIGRVAIFILAIGVISLAGSGSSLAFLAALPGLSWMITFPAIAVQWIIWPLGLVLQFGFSTSLSSLIITAMATSATSLAVIQFAAIVAAIWVLYPSAREFFKIVGKIIGNYVLKKRFPNLVDSSSTPLHDTVKNKSPGEELSFLESVVAIFKNSLGGAKLGYVFEQMVDLIAARLFLVPIKNIAKSTAMNGLYLQKGELIQDEEGKPVKDELGQWIKDGSGNKINFTQEGELIKNIDLANRLAYQHLEKLARELTRAEGNAILNSPLQLKLRTYLNIVNYYYERAQKKGADAELALSEWRVDYNNLNTEFLKYLETNGLDRARLYSTDESFEASVKKAEALAYLSAETRVFNEFKERILAAGPLAEQKKELKAILHEQLKKGGYEKVDAEIEELWIGDPGIIWGGAREGKNEDNADELERANPDGIMEQALENFRVMCGAGKVDNPAKDAYKENAHSPFRVLTDYIKEETRTLLTDGPLKDQGTPTKFALNKLYGQHANVGELKAHIARTLGIYFLENTRFDEEKKRDLLHGDDGILTQLFGNDDTVAVNEETLNNFYDRLDKKIYHVRHGNGELKDCLNYLKKEIDETAESITYPNYVAPDSLAWNLSPEAIAASFLDYTTAHSSFDGDKLRAVKYSLKDKVMNRAEIIIEKVEKILTQNTENLKPVSALVKEASNTNTMINNNHELIQAFTTGGKKLGKLSEKDIELDEEEIKTAVNNSLSDIRAEVHLPSTSEKKLIKTTPLVNGNKRWLAFFTVIAGATITVAILLAIGTISLPAVLGLGTIGFYFATTLAGAVFVPAALGMFFILTKSRLNTLRLKTLFKTAYAGDPSINSSKESVLSKYDANVYGQASNPKTMPEFIERMQKARQEVKENQADKKRRRFDPTRPVYDQKDDKEFDNRSFLGLSDNGSERALNEEIELEEIVGGENVGASMVAVARENVPHV